MIFGWWRRDKGGERAPVILPAAVASNPAEAMRVVELAAIIPRPSGDDGPRTLVMAGPLGDFIYNDRAAAARMARAFPDLSKQDLAAATKRLRARILEAGCPMQKTMTQRVNDERAEMFGGFFGEK